MPEADRIKRNDLDGAEARPVVLANDADKARLKKDDGGEDANVAELKTKVARLVESRFGGDYRKAYAHYDTAGSGVGRDELMKLLKDASIGNGFTRGMWASGILSRVDASGDGRIQWPEFESILKG